MHRNTVLKHHADLVDRMADSLGIDLEEATLRGQIRPGDIADAVLRCTGCSNPEHCAHWLDTRTGPADTMPGYCRNGDLFSSLMTEQDR